MANLRKQILRQHGLAGFHPATKKLMTFDESAVPFTKTPLMRLLELKHCKPIEQLLEYGSIYELESKLGVDYSTISKWRKTIRLSRQQQTSLLPT